MSKKRKIGSICLYILSCLTVLPAFASQDDANINFPSEELQSLVEKFNPKKASIVLLAGGFTASQGKAQYINIDGLVGDHFKVKKHHTQNLLLGLSYYIEGCEQERFKLQYGIDSYYLAKTSVKGDIAQENMFTNLAYHYDIAHFPNYLAAKALIQTSTKHDIVLDLGVGPNIIRASNFKERSLDGGITIPERPFSNKTTVTFSGTAGIGINFNNIAGNVPIELGYRFFYLGRGHLNKKSPQFMSHLNTGNIYANALTVSTTF